MRISQREARRLRKRVQDLERAEESRRYAWASEWPGGTHLEDLNLSAVSAAKVYTARRLGCAIVGMCVGEETLRLVAVPLKDRP